MRKSRYTEEQIIGFIKKAENNTLKKLLAEAHLDIHALNTAFGVKRSPHRPSVPPSPP